MKYPSIPMSDIREQYRPGPGRHWFDRETMSFFKTKLPAAGLHAGLHGNFFITSEVNPSGDRRYTVRLQSEKGDISSPLGFHCFDTLAEARDEMFKYLEKLEAAE